METQTTPEEKIFYKHLVLAEWRGKYEPEVRVDSFLVLEWSEEMTSIEETELMLEGGFERKGLSEKESRAINGMIRRSRFMEKPIGGGLLVFDSPVKWEVGDLETYLNHTDNLKKVIEEAKVF